MDRSLELFRQGSIDHSMTSHGTLDAIELFTDDNNFKVCFRAFRNVMSMALVDNLKMKRLEGLSQIVFDGRLDGKLSRFLCCHASG